MENWSRRGTAALFSRFPAEEGAQNHKQEPVKARTLRRRESRVRDKIAHLPCQLNGS